MEFHITGRHFNVTDALKQYIEGKIQKLDKYSLKIESVHVIMDVQKFHQICEITLTAKNLRLTAKEDDLDMYAAFDKAMDNIGLQLSRKHDRFKDHKSKRFEAEASFE